MGWMTLKFPGTCKGCGARLATGARGNYGGKGAGVVACDACSGTAKPATAAAATAPDTEEGVVDFGAGTVGGTAFELPADAAPVDAHAIPAPVRALDPHQLLVAAHRAGEAVVAAAAGSGKTTVLVERTADLITDGALPESILTLTFNRNAAITFRSRLAQRLGAELAGRCRVYTFHAYCLAVLRAWYPGERRMRPDRLIGTEDGPSPYSIAGPVVRALEIDTDLEALLSADARLREAMIDPSAPGAVAAAGEVLRLPAEAAATALQFSDAYGVARRQAGAMDFVDMLVTVAKAIRRPTAAALALQGTVTHLQVDEAQDGNEARWTIALHLGAQAASFVSVGDLRQSIAGFSGAKPKLFKARLDNGAKLYVMPINHRSGAAIVAAGNAIAAGADWNLGGACQANPDRGTGRVSLWGAGEAVTPGEEAAMIADEIAARLADGVSPNTFGILVRTNAGTVAPECALVARGIPVRVRGAQGGIWGTSLGRNVLAYLRAAAGVATDDLTRVANRPLRYCKTACVKAALEAARGGGSLIAGLRHGERGARTLAADISELADLPWAHRCKQAADWLIEDLRERNGDDIELADDDKRATILALADAAREAGDLATIEEQIEALRRAPKDTPAVEISTIHKAKGDEWGTVFVIQVADGVLPHRKAVDPEDIEEERRLFYVAVTRGREETIITSGSATPSHFLTYMGIEPTEPPPGPKGGAPIPVVGVPIPVARAIDAIQAARNAGAEIAVAARLEMDAEMARLISDDPDPAPVPEAVAGAVAEIAAALAQREAETQLTAEGLNEARRIAATRLGSDVQTGPKAVAVRAESVLEVLAPLGFVERTDSHGQRIYDAPGPRNTVIRIYSSISVGAEVTRDVGEDSIRVVALLVAAEQERPVLPKDAYVARTKGWRLSLITRIEHAVAGILAAPACDRCGGPTRERSSKKHGGGSFFGCVNFPVCKGYGKAPSALPEGLADEVA